MNNPEQPLKNYRLIKQIFWIKKFSICVIKTCFGVKPKLFQVKSIEKMYDSKKNGQPFTQMTHRRMWTTCNTTFLGIKVVHMVVSTLGKKG